MVHTALRWNVSKRLSRLKTQFMSLRITVEQKKAIDSLAVELGVDITELVQMGIVQIYEGLGQGISPKFRALASDDAMWREIGAKAKERSEEERKAIRGRQ